MGHVYAHVLVILPSKFSGGEIYCSDNGTSKGCECSSMTETTVLAWYPDIATETKPITSGYRLALAFDIISAKTPLVSNFASKCVNNSDDYNLALKHVRDVLLLWKQGKGGTMPKKIAFRLQRRYSQEKLNREAIKKSDAQVVALFDQCATDLGFHVCLANIVTQFTGPTNISGDILTLDGPDIAAILAEDGGSSYSKTRLERVVDLDGTLIMHSLAIDRGLEIIFGDPDILADDPGMWDHRRLKLEARSLAGSAVRLIPVNFL